MIVSLKLTALLKWFFWEASAKFRWNRERERRGQNNVLIWFAEVTCLSDTPHAKKRSLWVGERENRREIERESESS